VLSCVFLRACASARSGVDRAQPASASVVCADATSPSARLALSSSRVTELMMRYWHGRPPCRPTWFQTRLFCRITDQYAYAGRCSAALCQDFVATTKQLVARMGGDAVAYSFRTLVQAGSATCAHAPVSPDRYYAHGRLVSSDQYLGLHLAHSGAVRYCSSRMLDATSPAV
jgi:hypothetical protein